MRKFKDYSAYLIISIPVIIFFGLFFRYTVNAPINDDYQAVLEFLNNCITTRSIKEKLVLIFSQHNEHRIVYDRLWTIISYKLQKNVDFNFLALVGNLSLVATAILLYSKFKKLQYSAIFFVPVTVLLFNITSSENMTFAMAALSNFTVVFFILVSLSFLTGESVESKRNLFLSFSFLVLALFTQGGGIVLIPVSLLILAYKKEYKNLIIYGILSIVLLVLYFHGYKAPPHNADLITTFYDFKVRILLFIFAFLGNGFNYSRIFTTDLQESVGFTTLIGFCLFVWFCYISKKKYYQKNLFNYSVIFFIFLSAGITAISRVSFGLEMASSSRYRIIGLILLVCAYFWMIETYPMHKKKQLFYILAASLVYYLQINLNQTEYLYAREKLTYTGILFYNSGDASFINGDKRLIDLYKNILSESDRLNTYHFPEDKKIEFYFPYSTKLYKDLKENTGLELRYSLDTITKNKDSYLVEGWAYLYGKSANDQKVYIGIKNQNDVIPTYFSCKQTPRYDLNPYFNKFNLKMGGYQGRIKASEIKPGENTVSILVQNGSRIKMIQTTKKIIR